MRPHRLLVLLTALALTQLWTVPAAGASSVGRTGTGAVVTGRVLGARGPVADATVTVLDAGTSAVLAAATTSPSGRFTISGLAAGSVKVQVSKDGWLTSFAYGRHDLASAHVFRLRSGRTLWLPGLRLRAEAVVEGQVLAWMDPLLGATVTVYDARTGAVIRSVTLADTEDRYRIGGLPAGLVKVGASKPGYLPGYASGVRSLASATAYRLRAGQVLAQTWDERMILYIDLTPAWAMAGTDLGRG